MRILCSACLLGARCRYNGEGKPSQRVLALLKDHELVPVCPEQLGGLSTPRPPCEMQGDGRVISKPGNDKSAEFTRGAEEALMLLRLTGCEAALLKARSPSCGKGMIYDGSFSGTLKPGNGVFAQRLIDEGVPVYTEEDDLPFLSSVFCWQQQL